MIIEVELHIRYTSWSMVCSPAHLQDIVAEAEQNDMLHPQIPFDIGHALCQLQIFKGVIVISKELLHHVCFEMLEKIHFVLELARVFTNGIIMSVGGAVNRALDAVKVSEISAAQTCTCLPKRKVMTLTPFPALAPVTTNR